MAKFIAKNLRFEQNTYFAPNGAYIFKKGVPTEVTDEKDIEFFRSEPNIFEEVGIKEMAESEVKEIVKKIRKKK